MAGLRIIATGNGQANRVITNFDLEKIMDTNDEWITTRTGIHERRYVDENQNNTTMALDGAWQAIHQSGIDPTDIHVLIVATFTPYHKTPSISADVAKELGLAENSLCFDLNAACSGFIYATTVANALLAQRKEGYALVIGSEILTNVTNYDDRGTAVLFGDGAGAVLLQYDEQTTFASVAGFVPDVDNVLSAPKELGKVVMDGQAVFRFATEKMTYAVKQLLNENAITLEDVDLIIPHQANKRIIDFAAKKLRCDVNKFFLNIQHYGNTSSASIPIALHEANVGKNKTIICVGFGAGLNYGAILIRT